MCLSFKSTNILPQKPKVDLYIIKGLPVWKSLDFSLVDQTQSLIAFRNKSDSELKKEIENLFSSARQVSKRFGDDKLASLPDPARKYFNYALKQNQPFINYVRLKHGGQFKPSKKWASIKGVEYFTADPPGFVWFGKISFVSARDMYVNGSGGMKIRLLSIFKLVDAEGQEFNQGELVRWLSETPWFPTALLPSGSLKWETIDALTAKVSLIDRGLTVEGTFYFNEVGQITKFKTKRWGDGKFRDWICQYHEYQAVEGMHIPFYAEAGWNSESEEEKYAKFRLEEIDYGHPSEFGSH